MASEAKVVEKSKGGLEDVVATTSSSPPFPFSLFSATFASVAMLLILSDRAVGHSAACDSSRAS